MSGHQLNMQLYFQFYCNSALPSSFPRDSASRALGSKRTKLRVINDIL
jgi:hypothetical protein